MFVSRFEKPERYAILIGPVKWRVRGSLLCDRSGAVYQTRFIDRETQMAKKTGKLVFEGKDKEHYDALMHARDMILGQMQYHAEDALDCSNADKRGVTTHMADVPRAGKDKSLLPAGMNFTSALYLL